MPTVSDSASSRRIDSNLLLVTALTILVCHLAERLVRWFLGYPGAGWGTPVGLLIVVAAWGYMRYAEPRRGAQPSPPVSPITTKDSSNEPPDTRERRKTRSS